MYVRDKIFLVRCINPAGISPELRLRHGRCSCRCVLSLRSISSITRIVILIIYPTNYQQHNIVSHTGVSSRGCIFSHSCPPCSINDTRQNGILEYHSSKDSPWSAKIYPALQRVPRSCINVAAVEHIPRIVG